MELLIGKNVTKAALMKLDKYFPGCCTEISFENCTVNAKNIVYGNSFIFTKCKFTNCTFKDYDHSFIQFVNCEFKICEFSFKNNSHLEFTQCNFVKNDAGFSSLLFTDWCCFDTLAFRECNLDGLTYKNADSGSAGRFKCNEFIYTPTKDRIMKNDRINEDPLISVLCPLRCPEEDSFIAWKKIFVETNELKLREALCKLKIPKDALRTSGIGNKCRASKVKVLKIIGVENPQINELRRTTGKKYKAGFSINYPKFKYEVGKVVEPLDDFDPNRFHECSSGIHFFMSKQDAINY